MKFSYSPNLNYYYEVFVPIVGTPYMSSRVVDYGSFVTALLSLDLKKLENNLLYKDDSYFLSVLKENCELEYLAMLFYEELLRLAELRNISLYNAFVSQKNIYNTFQDTLAFYLSHNYVQDNSNLDLLVKYVEDKTKIEVTFERPDEFKPGEAGTIMTYSVFDVFSMIILDLMNILDLNIPIKKCANCGRFFIPSKRSNEIYCNRIYKNGKTCKDVGYSIKQKEDPFKSIFATARKTQHARIRYNKHIKDYKEKHYEPWLKAASEARDHFSSINDIEGFKNWVENHKNSF